MNHVIVTGMHRSGTSAMGRILHESGYVMGFDMHGKSKSNIYGHFEEKSFVEFNSKLTKKYFFEDYRPWLIRNNTLKKDFESEDILIAKELWKIHIEKGGRGIKDPRICLFIDFYTNVIPNIKFIICVRHPYDVYLSILRRNTIIGKLPTVQPDVILKNWYYHNKFIYDSIKNYGINNFLIVNVSNEYQTPKLLQERLSSFLEFKVNAINNIDNDVFTNSNLKTDVEKLLFKEWFPKVTFLYNNLTNIANSGMMLYNEIDTELNFLSNKGTVIQFEEELKKIRENYN